MMEKVDSYTYLGEQVIKDRRGTLDIQKRKALAYANFNRFNNIWSTRGISRKTKAMLFKTVVLSMVLYDREMSKIKKEDEKKLDTFQTKSLRRIYHCLISYCGSLALVIPLAGRKWTCSLWMV